MFHSRLLVLQTVSSQANQKVADSLQLLPLTIKHNKSIGYCMTKWDSNREDSEHVRTLQLVYRSVNKERGATSMVRRSLLALSPTLLSIALFTLHPNYTEHVRLWI